MQTSTMMKSGDASTSHSVNNAKTQQQLNSSRFFSLILVHFCGVHAGDTARGMDDRASLIKSARGRSRNTSLGSWQSHVYYR